MGKLSERLWNFLSCSYCGDSLKMSPGGAVCSSCGSRYDYTPSGSLDCRIPKEKVKNIEFVLGGPPASARELSFEGLGMNRDPEVDFSGISAKHISMELLSYFPKSKREGDFALDLGCGTAPHRGACERAGYEWVGLDHDSADAPILGDAHALPFKDETFGFIFSVAVLEHIRFPFIMIREVSRVLKPGGKFIGTVAFLEPYHSDSYYHYTHLGVASLLGYGGFTIEKIAPSADWPALKAQARMGLFPKIPIPLAAALVMPLEILHRLWWKAGAIILGNDIGRMRLVTTAGAFSFIATKES